MHVATEVAPVIVEYLPAPHKAHVKAPVLKVYLPALQLVHASEVEAPVTPPILPAAQSMHVAEVEAPVAVEYLPKPQLVHAAVPVVVLYLPAAHAQQAVPAPAPSQSVFPGSHENTCGRTTCARPSRRTHSRTLQSAQRAIITEASNIIGALNEANECDRCLFFLFSAIQHTVTHAKHWVSPA
jgi:hypothetical protein